MFGAGLMHFWMMDWVLAFVIGTGTSLVELLSRYRDEPFKVLATSQFAWIYLLLNGLLALGAHQILLEQNVADLEVETGRLGLAAIAGLSAAVVLRSKVFTARLGDESISIGPGYIVDQLLGIIDRQIDRRRALQRVRIVTRVMEGRDFEGSRVHASTMITGSRQNLSLQEQRDLANQIREILDRKISDQERSYALGFILLDFMGEEFLEAVAEKLPRAELASEGPSAPDFQAKGITDTGAGVVASRTWGASLPVQRAKVVRELLVGVDLDALRKRVVSLLDSGQLGANEDERLMLRQQIAGILAREGSSEDDKVFGIGFAVHALWDSARFREAFGDLPRRSETSDGEDDELELDSSDSADSGSDRPKTGEHPAIGAGAGPLPIARR